MVLIDNTDTSFQLILTLEEKRTLTNPYYLFVFTHQDTGNTIKFLKFSEDDESDYPLRYQQFTIDPAVVFLNAKLGFYLYNIYEQLSSTNTDVALTGAEVENGKMRLITTDADIYTEHSQTVTFKTYGN
jgi:hypothetical protein